MHVIHRRGWELPESRVTPERLFFDRRQFLAAAGMAGIALSSGIAQAQRITDLASLPDPSASLYPAKRNESFKLDLKVTDESINVTYNNYYEFGSAKTISRAAQALPIRPWTVKIDRAYVTDCHRDKVKEGMLESMIALARGFGLKVVAEGIETFHESHKLQGLGVAIGQGFLFAKPMAKDDLLAKISAFTGKRRVEQPRSWWQFGAPARTRTA